MCGLVRDHSPTVDGFSFENAKPTNQLDKPLIRNRRTMCTTKARHTHYKCYKSANKSQRDIRLNFVCVLFVSLVAIKKNATFD